MRVTSGCLSTARPTWKNVAGTSRLASNPASLLVNGSFGPSSNVSATVGRTPDLGSPRLGKAPSNCDCDDSDTQ